MDRRRIAALGIGAVVATSVAGFVAGSRITSPAEVASRTAAPEASLITVPVEERVLSTDVVTRGTGRFGSPQKLSVAASALKPNPGLVAEVPLVGAELVEGAVAASASGRPLFLLVGVRPISRDLGPGLSGDDVRQLEESLVRLGFDVGPVDGAYDDLTAAAVAAWYAKNGYAPFTATEGQLAAVRAREAEMATASVDALTAADSLASAEAASTATAAALATAVNRDAATSRAVKRAKSEAAAANAAAATEVAARQTTLDRLRSGQPTARGTPAEVAAARADLANAQANESVVRATGAQAVAEAQTALNQATAKLTSAKSSADAADAAATADVDAKQAALDAVLADPLSTPTQIAVAEADLAAAQATATNVHAVGVLAVADAQAVLDNAPHALQTARAQAAAADTVAAADVAARQAALDNLLAPIPVTPSEIAAAESDLAIAKANADTARLTGERTEDEAAAAAAEAAADIGVKRAAARAADTAVANAKLAAGSRTTAADAAAREADLARRQAGVQVPADELVFVATGPVRVSELLVGTGDPAVGGMMTVTDSLVHVDGALAIEDASLVKPGMTVQIDEPDLGIAAEGIVNAVAPSPGTHGVDGFHVYFEITVAAPPPNLVGASVRLTIPVESTGGKVLAVPVSALTLAADGSSRVQQFLGGSDTKFVPVDAGLTADGFVEISTTDNSLKAGDLVVIGVAAQDAAPDTGPPASGTGGNALGAGDR